MTKQIVMSEHEYKKIHKTLDKIRDIASEYVRTLDEANTNLETIEKLVWKAYEAVRLHPDIGF